MVILQAITRLAYIVDRVARAIHYLDGVLILSDMEHPLWVRIGLAVFAILMLFYGFYWFSNMICRSSVRFCTSTDDCPAASACVNYGDESICSPEYCADRKDWTNLPLEAKHVVQKGMFQLSKMASALGQWLSGGK